MVLPFILYYLPNSFCLQIAYRKVRNLQIGVVGKVSIKNYHAKKSATCIISIVFNAPAVAYAHS